MTSTLALLQQIQDGAVSSTMPVAELLRRCQMLASRLDLPELGEWVRFELNGYPDEVELPTYRIMTGIARGHFLGPFGSGVRNAVLPAGNLPEEYRHWGTQAYIRQPIAVLQEVAVTGDHGTVYFPWPGDLIAAVRSRFYENMALGQAWLEIGRSCFVSAVETVRNRILTFALEAERFVPKDEAAPQKEAVAGLSQAFHTYVYGNVTNLAQASTDFRQQGGIAPGDLPALLTALGAVGVESDEIAELEAAIGDDPPQASDAVGPRVAKWLGSMVTKAASGVWSVTLNTATTVLPKLISRYYNIES